MRKIRGTLRKLHFTEVKNTAEDLLKYPFTKDAFDDIKKYYITPNVPHDTKVYVAEIKDQYIKDVFLEYIGGSIACGIYCDFQSYAKTKDGFHKISLGEDYDVLAREPVYLHPCPNETSMITTGGSIETGHPSLSNVTQWIYSGGKFEYKATYPGLEHVPACGADTNAGKRRVNAGTLAVYGEPLKVQPCKTGIPGSNFGWEDIKPYLPPGILSTPEKPMSHEQIVGVVDKLS